MSEHNKLTPDQHTVREERLPRANTLRSLGYGTYGGLLGTVATNLLALKPSQSTAEGELLTSIARMTQWENCVIAVADGLYKPTEDEIKVASKEEVANMMRGRDAFLRLCGLNQSPV